MCKRTLPRLLVVFKIACTRRKIFLNHGKRPKSISNFHLIQNVCLNFGFRFKFLDFCSTQALKILRFVASITPDDRLQKPRESYCKRII